MFPLNLHTITVTRMLSSGGEVDAYVGTHQHISALLAHYLNNDSNGSRFRSMYHEHEHELSSATVPFLRRTRSIKQSSAVAPTQVGLQNSVYGRAYAENILAQSGMSVFLCSYCP